MHKISKNYLEEQKQLHSDINYGTASLQHVTTIKNLLINTKIKTISDYGAGKKNLQKGLLNSGFTEFKYFPYDPVFPEYGEPVAADLVTCIDVMEHIENEFLEEGQTVKGVIIALENSIKIQRALSVTKDIEFYATIAEAVSRNR